MAKRIDTVSVMLLEQVEQRKRSAGALTIPSVPFSNNHTCEDD